MIGEQVRIAQPVLHLEGDATSMSSPQTVTIDDTFHVELVHSVRGDSVAPAGPALAKHGCKVEFPGPRKDALSAIKREAFRLGRNGTRQGFEFAQRLFRALPELRNS